MTGTHDERAREAARQLGALAGNLSARGFAAYLTQAGRYATVNAAFKIAYVLTPHDGPG
jgi:hypothetical protein